MGRDTQDCSVCGLFLGFQNAYMDCVCSCCQLKGWICSYPGEYYRQNYSTFLGKLWLCFLCVFLECLVDIAARCFLEVPKRHVQTELRLDFSCRAAWGRTKPFLITGLFSVVFRLVLSEMFRDWINQWSASTPRALAHDLALMIYMQRCQVWILPGFILFWLSYFIVVYVLPHKCWDYNLN